MEEYVKSSDFEGKRQVGLKEKVINFLQSPFWMVAVLVLVAIIFFCLGRASSLQDSRPPVRILGNPDQANLLVPGEVALTGQVGQTAAVVESGDGSVVASKNGTKYHYPWCAGAKQIAAKNLVKFASPEAARKAGLTPASNCKGLK